jgi:hypothetical protein
MRADGSKFSIMACGNNVGWFTSELVDESLRDGFRGRGGFTTYGSGTQFDSQGDAHHPAVAPALDFKKCRGF